MSGAEPGAAPDAAAPADAAERLDGLLDRPVEEQIEVLRSIEKELSAALEQLGRQE